MAKQIEVTRTFNAPVEMVWQSGQTLNWSNVVGTQTFYIPSSEH